jgi:hypothetical protein
MRKKLREGYVVMNHFRRSTVADLSKELQGEFSFYAKVIKHIDNSRVFVLVSDGEAMIVVDLGDVGPCILEKGEVYRFAGGMGGPVLFGDRPIGRVNLRLTPVRCEGFDSEGYSRVLLSRSHFLSGFEGLISYVIRHKDLGLLD